MQNIKVREFKYAKCGINKTENIIILLKTEQLKACVISLPLRICSNNAILTCSDENEQCTTYKNWRDVC